jgi:dihydroflavonol-4-reductase
VIRVASGAFVTGGTGFLGRAIVRRLVAEGRHVTAAGRSEGSRRSLEEMGARPVPGDVLDPQILSSGMKGCDVVYHAAGVNAFCLPDPSVLFRVNVTGSRNVVLAAASAGIRRVVYTSSAATLGEKAGTVGTERSTHRGSFLSRYERSKYEAERLVLETARTEAVEVMCVNPSSVQGPGRSGGSARLLLDYVNGKLKVVVDTRMSILDIDDCTTGHLLAETRGRPGERYVLNGGVLTVREAIASLAEITGIAERPRFIPPGVAMAGAAAVEVLARARRRRPPVCREMVRTLLHGHAYDGSKAAADLGLRYTPTRETLRRTIAWCVREGLVSRPLPGVSVAGS